MKGIRSTRFIALCIAIAGSQEFVRGQMQAGHVVEYNIEKETTVAGSPSKVWKAVSNPEQLPKFSNGLMTGASRDASLDDQYYKGYVFTMKDGIQRKAQVQVMGASGEGPALLIMQVQSPLPADIRSLLIVLRVKEGDDPNSANVRWAAEIVGTDAAKESMKKQLAEEFGQYLQAMTAFFQSNDQGQTGETGGLVIIRGKLTGDLKGHNKMYMYTRTSNDSTVVKDGNYTFSFPFTATVFKVFLPEYVIKQGMMYQPFGILIDQAGTYDITTDIAKGMQSSQVKGSEATELYRQFDRDESEGYGKINRALTSRFGGGWYQLSETDAAYPALQKAQDSLQQAYLVPLADKLVSGHPDSYATPFVLNGGMKNVLSLEQKEKYYSMLSDRMKQSEQGKLFSYNIQGIKSSGIGSTVRPFTLPDPKEHPVNFADLKGKYVLIDFWASWCVPCRQSFPHLRDMYASYKEKGFEIYSISIDQDKKAWLKAVKEENNPWLQALDTKSISQSGFAVSGVPTAFLIGPEGKIVEKQVGFDDAEKGPVDKKLEELFGPVSHQKPVPMVKMQ